jgi:hypothetical protein
MTYVGSPFEQLPLGQGLPTVTMQDRWNTSLDGWEADIADVVAHLASANAKIAGYVAEPADPVATVMFFELDEAAHCVQRAIIALDKFSHIAGLVLAAHGHLMLSTREPSQRGASLRREQVDEPCETSFGMLGSASPS